MAPFFFTAEDVAANVSQKRKKDPPHKRTFIDLYNSKLAALASAAKPSNKNVVHGYGIVAERALRRGEEVLDPAAKFVSLPPKSSAIMAGNVIQCQDGGGGFFLLRDDTNGRAAPSFYLNEARDTCQPNVEWLIDRRGRESACLYWHIIRDIAKSEELLIVYDPDDR
mmetsp:Transcript_5284/g.7826  ORF Transcript_5284/g.7826 Transcript_5284/m.7826 type:complete len:167 (+) Transcript_5284:1782-2282(+)|eukprot:CAMPEP_0197323822 /NCGR_PEP_ID=MMETSP0891-20130614/70754_1 /TAXON_ID=44058 ORGANISM="Aureoumbra lagunensis, Strain CCMP1510" /NCGR_SAMPLE_ID=MMETSP0891 /ASSEMBLY_ACC=CAM_ASM_000534 /LENGTH=166 /DNA_ID=CAMNT_0042816549 /DNA_START=2751 /DNA_END=3251 /DNA_ORIENTATION=-